MSYIKKDSLQEINSNNNHKLNKIVLFVFVLLFLISSVFAPVFSNKAYAATTDLNTDTENYLYIAAMYGCLASNTGEGSTNNLHDGWLHDYIDESNADNGLWFVDSPSGEQTVGFFTNSETGKESCNSILSKAKSKLGYSSYTGKGGLLCDLMNKADLKRDNGTTCETGYGKIKNIKSLASPFIGLANEKMYENKGVSFTAPERYLVYLAAFKSDKGCHAKVAGDQTLPESDTYYINVNTVGEDKTKSGANYEGYSKSTTVPVFTDMKTGFGVSMKCSDIAAGINSYVDNYVTYLKQNPQEEPNTGGSNSSSDPTDENKTTCNIDGVGWIVCPAMGFLANITDSAFNFLANNMLQTNSKLISSDTDSATYKAWKVMRDIANIAFVIAFLIIIYSQLSGFGLDNYGIKKLLPKIIIAAILVNLSYIICQLAVDVSNILGFSLKSLFDNMTVLMKMSDSSTSNNNLLQANALMALLLAGGVSLAFAISIPVIISALFALIVIILMLLARSALIVLLIVISPLAFVAYLLPNTEEYFTKWRKMFTALLLVFPIISVVFGASGLAANIIKSTSDDEVGRVMALGIMLIPLFVVPGLLKKAIDSAGSIGAKISGAGDNFGKRVSDGVTGSTFGQHLEQRKKDAIARTKTGNYTGINPLRRGRSTLNRGLNSDRRYNSMTGGYGAQMVLAGQSQLAKDTQEAESLFNNNDVLAKVWAESGGDETKSADFATLSDADKAQFRLMRNAGHHKKATSYLASAKVMSEAGEGNLTSIQSALNNAAANGADEIQRSNAWMGARSAYRKAGRGDVLGEMEAQLKANGMKAPVVDSEYKATKSDIEDSQQSTWDSIAPASTHKTGAKSTSYKYWLMSSKDNFRNATAALDKMEGRASATVAKHILDTASGYGIKANSIQEVKKALDLIN